MLVSALALAGSTLNAQQVPAPAAAAPIAQAPAAPADNMVPATAPALPILKVFQFPPNMIPRIDGKDDDWAIVPDSYTITLADMHDDEKKHAAPDPKDLDIHVKVGWVKGLNRLYFLYEAYKNYWDFADPGLHNDTFEVVVDGDRSGGPLIPRFRNNMDQDEWDAHFSMHGVQAQNYHIMTPAEGKDWAMAWGCQPWDKELPYANHAQTYNFRPGSPATTSWSSTSRPSTTPVATAPTAPSNRSSPRTSSSASPGPSSTTRARPTARTTASGTSRPSTPCTATPPTCASSA